MRVISQDGTIDIPYDCFSLSMSVGKYKDVEEAYIYCQNSSSPIGTKLAEYSTEAKAIKAMRTLREEYLKYMEIEGHADLTGQGIIQPNFWVLPKVFQFPQDEEIEV